MRTKLATLASLFLISCVTQPVTPEKVIETPETNDDVVMQKIDALLATNILKVGKNDAPLSLLQFTEYHCDFCKEFHSVHMPHVLQPLIDEEKLQLQVAILPLEKYPNSTKAAAAVHCAKQQAKGIEMHNLLMNQDWTNDVASTLELDEGVYNTCMTATETASILDEQRRIAEELEVSVVPTFFLNGDKLVGLQYESELQGRLEYALPQLSES